MPTDLQTAYEKMGLIPRLSPRATELVDQLSGVRVPPTYFFVFDDGTCGWSSKPPTDNDIGMILEGALQVFKIAGICIGQYTGKGQETVPVEELNYIDEQGGYHTSIAIADDDPSLILETTNEVPQH